LSVMLWILLGRWQDFQGMCCLGIQRLWD